MEGAAGAEIAQGAHKGQWRYRLFGRCPLADVVCFGEISLAVLRRLSAGTIDWLYQMLAELADPVLRDSAHRRPPATRSSLRPFHQVACFIVFL